MEKLNLTYTSIQHPSEQDMPQETEQNAMQIRLCAIPKLHREHPCTRRFALDNTSTPLLIDFILDSIPAYRFRLKENNVTTVEYAHWQ